MPSEESNKFYIVNSNRRAPADAIEKAVKQIIIDIQKLQKIKISNIIELSFRRKRIINSMAFLKLNSNIILSDLNISFGEFISKRVDGLIDYLLELLEAYDICNEYNRCDLFYTIIDLREIKNIITNQDDMYRKNNLKMISN